MKRFLYKFEYTPEFIESCIHECLKTRWRRRDTSYFFADYISTYILKDKTIDRHKLAKQLRVVANTKRYKLYGIVEKMSYTFYDDIKNKTISFNPIRYQKRKDRSSQKVRNIGIASIKQQVFDYIAVNTCMTMFNSKIGTYQCASIPNRGCVYGKKKIEKWIRKNPKKNKYAFKCDVSKFYPSVNQDRLKELLARDIKNKDVLYVLYSLIDTYQEGLSIGSYLSQYLANYYMSYAYHFLEEQCYKIKKKRRSDEVERVNLVSHCLIYMDDIIIFGSRKADVKMAAKKLEKFLNEFLLLELKPSKQLFPVEKQVIDMMGYKIYIDRTEIRKRIFFKARKLFIKYKGKTNVKKMTRKDAQSIISYYGYIKHSDSKTFRKKYKVDKTLKQAKGVLSNAGKKS